MKTNPGGTIAPSEVIGRDELIQRLWGTLKSQSVLLGAERRMGKTCVIKKMGAESPEGMITIYRDLENIHSPEEFVSAVLSDVINYLGRFQKTAARALEFLGQFSGHKIGSAQIPKIAAAHWKALLNSIFQDLSEHKSHFAVLFWDEFPSMIKNIKDRCSPQIAMEILDALRALRQTHKELRMVYTGSIGLHNIIKSLKKTGYTNTPINDMLIVSLPPLRLADGIDLAARLLEGEGYEVDLQGEIARTIANQVDCIPYYIHHVISQIKTKRTPLTREGICQLVQECILDGQNPWSLQHYLERIDGYYDPQDHEMIRTILDVLSLQEKGISFDELFNLVKSQIVTGDSEKARNSLTLLKQDHYLIQDKQGRYAFTYSIIKRWWKLHRGLTK